MLSVHYMFIPNRRDPQKHFVHQSASASMPSTTLNAFVSTIALLAGSGRAAEVKVNWRDMSLAKQAVTAGRGDTVVIDWAGTVNVQEVATKAELDKCDGTNSIGRSGVRSPAKIKVPTTAADGYQFYYLSTVKDQCSNGKHLTITVAGGEAFDKSGTCANIACRKNNDHNKGFKLDSECCAALGNKYYFEEAACASGYTYYQHQADSCKPLGTAPNLLARTATCCVKDGAAAPSGASLALSLATTAPPDGPPVTTASPASTSTLMLLAASVFSFMNMM